MKKILFAAFLISLSGMAIAQTSKKDTLTKPIPPPKVTAKKFAPPVIVRDTAVVAGKPTRKPGRVPPPPPPPLVVMRDTAKKH